VDLEVRAADHEGVDRRRRASAQQTVTSATFYVSTYGTPTQSTGAGVAFADVNRIGPTSPGAVKTARAGF